VSLEPVLPEGWESPSGYANGIVVPPGARLVFVAGQIAWDADQVLVGRGDFAAQFRQALANVLAVVDAAGGEPAQLASVTVFVKDKQAYLASTPALGAIWRELVGRHYPAMALVQVADLLEKDALVEIQAIAALAPPGRSGG
jgi:enamine deaminase RidA (YjgF/YER057c/UK114 family)